MNHIHMISTAALLLSVPGWSRAEVDADAFRYSRPFVDSVDTRSLAAVKVDLPIWDAVEGVVERVRLVNEENREVAYLPIPRSGEETRVRSEYLESEVENLQRPPENRIAFTLTVKTEGGEVDGLDFDIPMDNFERKLSVTGLADDGTETMLVEEALLYDYSRYLDLRGTRINLPKNAFTRFRVRVEQADEVTATPYRKWARIYEEGESVGSKEWQTLVNRPLRMDRVRAFDNREELVPGQPAIEAIPGLKWTEVNKEDAVVTTFELRTRYVPVSRMTLRAVDPVFSREVEVRAPRNGMEDEDWRTVERGRLSRIDYRDTHREETDISFPSQQEPRLRFVIHNRGNPSLDVEDLIASGPVWELVFLAEPGKQYRLLYGAAEATRSSYDVQSIRELMREGYTPAILALGDPDVQEPAGPGISGFLSSKGMLILAVLVMVGVIGLGFRRAVRAME